MLLNKSILQPQRKVLNRCIAELNFEMLRLLQSGDPSQHHMPGMPLGNPPPPPYWPQLQGQSSMHAMPPQPANTAYLPQHLAQRSQSHPSFGLPPGPYAAYHQRQQQQPPAFGLHSQPQQELQALEAQAQAQLHQAHENQARLAADQQLQAHQQAAGQAQQSGEALRDRAPGQSSIGGAFHPARWPSPGASDQHSVTQQASDQQRRFAELLASRHLQQNDPGLHRQFSGVQQPPGLPSQQFRNQIAEGTNPLLQEQAHRLASRGAVSTPEQMYHLNSLAGGPGAEQAYRLASLGSASPGEALAPLHDVGNQGQLYASAQADLSSNPAYSVNQFAQHIAAPATSAPASQGPA